MREFRLITFCGALFVVVGMLRLASHQSDDFVLLGVAVIVIAFIGKRLRERN